MNVLEKFALSRAAKCYRVKNYRKILKVFSILLNNPSEYGVYRNIFRILSLFETGHKDAKAEYGQILNERQLQLLPPPDEEYINLFIFKVANKNFDALEYKYDLSEVTNRTKIYFHERVIA